MAPNPENKCFGCGGSADAGMLLTFEQDNVQRKIVGKFVMGPRYQGGGGMLHGGIIAMLFAAFTLAYFRMVRSVEDGLHQVSAAADGLPSSTTQWAAHAVGEHFTQLVTKLADNVTKMGQAVRGAGDRFEVADDALASSFDRLFG